MIRDSRQFASRAAASALMAAVLFAVIHSANGQAMTLPVDPAPLVASTPGGDMKFTIEVADEVSERSAGLMFRETMADDHGMLFVFERTQPVGFWMKNTPMPLDLIFIAQDGTVRDVERGEPMSQALITPGVPVRFVLELKAGTAARDGITKGTTMRHPAIEKASGAGDPG